MGKHEAKGDKGMRKVTITIICAVLGGTFLGLFGVCVIWQCIDVEAMEFCQPIAVPFPCSVTGTELTALQLARYEGPFWEDNTETEVADVAALVIENGGTFLAEGAVILEWEQERMVFEFYDLPPGDRVLILEKDRKRFRLGTPLACYGWDREAYHENMGHVSAEDAGGAAMAVTNRTNGIVPVTQISYKTRDPGSGMFIGGISYRVQVRNLLPGERRIVAPYHYASGSSEILYVITWVEE